MIFPILHGVFRRESLAAAACVLFCLGIHACAPAEPPPPEFGAPVENEATFWPMMLETSQGRVEMYQPQPESLKGNVLNARAAFSLVRPNSTTPVFGALWFTADVYIDRDTRMANLANVRVTDVRFPDSSQNDASLPQAIGQQLSMSDVTFPMDQLTASLDTAQQEAVTSAQLNNSPPQILFSTAPATLISVNGPPKLTSLDGHPGVSRVANTPFILLVEDATHRYYLKAGPRWASAADITGPWADTTQVPPAIAAAGDELATPEPGTANAAGSNAITQPANFPGAPQLSPAAADAKIIVATTPTELIVSNGNPQFTPVGSSGGELLYAGNTESNLFLDQTTQQYFVLLSGRWYAATTLQGPWQYVASDKLPAAFAMIPPSSPKADVLSFVAGTAAARDAVLDAQIPQTADIRRDAGSSLSIGYDGQPQFQDVPESPGVAYAVNTPEKVLRVNAQYYCCHQAVWYQSDSPTGPWTVCTSVPSVIYTLPPSCPDYPVRYVSVYDYGPDYVVDGYLPGYLGTYIDGPTVVYGTGYVYPGWYGTVYFPPPLTWGFGAYYDPFVCAWGFDTALYWGGIGWFVYPWHDHWWHDHPHQHWAWHGWWGSGGFVHAHQIRAHFADARGLGAFNRGGPGTLSPRMPGTNHNPGWHNIYARNGNAARLAPTGRALTPMRVAPGARNDVFAGHDGQVYRRSNAGWETHQFNGGWTGVGHVPEAAPSYRPQNYGGYHGYAPPSAGIDQSFAARARGGYRAGTANSFGGVHGGGGGFHGGGGGFGGGGHGGGGGHR